MAVIQTIETFAELTAYVAAFMKPGGLPLLFVVGDPGNSKSWTIKKRFNKNRHVYIKAAKLTAFQLYKLLYRHRKKVIILDDVEDALKRDDTRKLLMQVCETDDNNRKVGWLGTESRLVVKQGKKTVPVPQEFSCSSRVCIICNNWDILRGRFGPLLDRGIVVFFEPPNAEIHEYVRTWFKEKDIFDFIGAHLSDISLHSIRFYTSAAEMKRHGLDWSKALLESWTNERKPESPEDILGRIMANPDLKTAKERIAAFDEQTGLKRRSFYNYKLNLPPTERGGTRSSGAI